LYSYLYGRTGGVVAADAFPGLGLGEPGKENLEETHKVPGAGRKVLRKDKLKE